MSVIIYLFSFFALLLSPLGSSSPASGQFCDFASSTASALVASRQTTRRIVGSLLEREPGDLGQHRLELGGVEQLRERANKEVMEHATRLTDTAEAKLWAAL